MSEPYTYECATGPCGWRAEAQARIAKLERLTKDLMLQLDELDFLKWEGGEESIGREIERAKAEARNAALEEAAEWLDNYDDFHAEGFAELVRALKTEPKP
jgi:hypothetical protein